jgi:RNA polymerase sigma factor (sigma-70 family)
MLSEHVDDAALVQATRRRDPEAWKKLIERHDGLIGSVCRAHRLSHTEAEDVRQTTWLRAVEHVHRLHSPQRVAAWLAMVARRECLRMLRQSVRVRPYEAELLENYAGLAPAPDADLLANERRAAVRSAVVTLPARDRALLGLLYSAEEPSYADIGRALEMPIGSIGPTRGRVLERLRAREPLAGLAAAA